MSSGQGDNRVRQINNGLRRYYQSLNTTYNDEFYNYCNDEEYTGDNFDDEIEAEAEECMLVEFHKDDGDNFITLFVIILASQSLQYCRYFSSL